MQKARLLFSGKSSFAIPRFPLNAVFFNIFPQKHYVLGGFPQEKGLLLNFRFATVPFGESHYPFWRAMLCSKDRNALSSSTTSESSRNI